MHNFSVLKLDSRLARNENLADKFSAVCDDVTKNLTITKLKRKHHSDNHNRQYDIHISYPDKYWKEVETVYKVLKRHNPNLNIFYDKMVLKRGKTPFHFFLIFFHLSVFVSLLSYITRTNLVGRGLSPNISQCCGCSTTSDTPSLKSSGSQTIPRLTLHGGFKIRPGRQQP